MSPLLDEKKRTLAQPVIGRAPNPVNQQYIQPWADHTDCADMPPDMVTSGKPSLLKKRLEDRGHTVTCDANHMRHEVHHKHSLVSVSYPVTTDDRPWTVTDRARILRALKLFGFFTLGGALAYAHFVAHWL